MKIFTVVMKVLAALAAVAGAVYLAATYGDKVVAWAKKMLGHGCCCECDCDCDECDCEGDCEECECECCECCDCEEPTEEPAAEEAVPETDVVAAEADFEG